ncbi:hypothetical protein K9M41_00965 [Candidatus Gracilibacteria bacterium]|nr:hypothetical protein [Candidatus Gracilibacteria bacterium]
MKTLIMKVNEKIPQELDLIKEYEGLGNRTATFNFLIKYYLLTKQNFLDNSIEVLNKLLDKTDLGDLPSAEEQLKEI